MRLPQKHFAAALFSCKNMKFYCFFPIVGYQEFYKPSNRFSRKSWIYCYSRSLQPPVFPTAPGPSGNEKSLLGIRQLKSGQKELPSTHFAVSIRPATVLLRRFPSISRFVPILSLAGRLIKSIPWKPLKVLSNSLDTTHCSVYLSFISHFHDFIKYD